MGLYSFPNRPAKAYDEEDRVRWDFARVNSARAERKAWFRIEAWECFKYLMGRCQNKRDTDDMVVELILADTVSASAALNIRRPDFSLMAMQPDDLVERITGRKSPLIIEIRRMIAEAVLHRCMNDDNGIYTAKDSIEMIKADSFWAYGIAKIESSGTWMPTLRKGEQMKSYDNVLMFDPDTGEVMEEPDARLIDQHYRIAWVDCRKYFIQRGAKANRVGVKFEGQEFEADIDVMKDAGIYEMKGVRPSGKVPDRFDMSDDDPVEREFEKMTMSIGRSDENGLENDDPWNHTVNCHFIQDHDEGRFKIIAKSNPKKYLLNAAIPEGVEGSIYVPLMYTKPASGRFYPRPPIASLLTPAREYNDVTRHMKIVRRGAVRKVFVTRGAYSDDVISQLQSVIDHELCYVDDAQKAARDYILVGANEAPHMSVDPLSADKAMRDLSRSGGRPAESRGEQSADTATQSIQIANQSNIRDEDRRDRFTNFLDMLGTKIIQLVQATLSIPIAVKITGVDVEPFWWRTQDRDEIEGQFVSKVRLESLQTENKAVQLKQMREELDVYLRNPLTAQRLNVDQAMEDVSKLSGHSSWLLPQSAATPPRCRNSPVFRIRPQELASNASLRVRMREVRMGVPKGLRLHRLA